MKSLQMLYSEIIANEELKKAFTDAAKNNTVVQFAKANGVETTIYEIKAFLEDKRRSDAELSADDLENAAGGKCSGDDALTSVYIGSFACPE